MGNRNIERFIPVINPPGVRQGSEFLHIINLGGRHEYVAELTGLNIDSGHVPSRGNRFDFKRFIRHRSVAVPLLPPIDQVPPLPIDTETQVTNVINERLDEILQMIEGNTNVLLCTHGSGFGLLPEQIIAIALRNAGHSIQSGFNDLSSFGIGRKRIKTHAILFEFKM